MAELEQATAAVPNDVRRCKVRFILLHKYEKERK
jgi:hypothetical protein